MKKTFVFGFVSYIAFVCIILFLGNNSYASNQPFIKIGLKWNSSYIKLSPTKQNGKLIAKGLTKKAISKSLDINCDNKNNIYINGKLFGKYVRVFPYRHGFISFNKRSYRGYFFIKAINRKLVVINVLLIEEYLYGIMKVEVNPNWPLEALKAQAVVARTYVVTHRKRHKDLGFDLCATTHCQVYRGVSAEVPILTKAVNATRGIIITYHGKPATVFYHADSGGHTASAKDVWGKNIPYLRGVPELYYNKCNSPYKHWKVKLTKDQIEKALKKAGYNITNLIDIQIYKRDRWGRAIQLLIYTSTGKIKISASKFRMIIGSSVIRSTWFDIKKRSQANKHSYLTEQKINKLLKELAQKGYISLDQLLKLLQAPKRAESFVKKFIDNQSPQKNIFIFEGRGWGHGVGMSQWGAKTLAEVGFNYKKILLHYFPGTHLKKIW